MQNASWSASITDRFVLSIRSSISSISASEAPFARCCAISRLNSVSMGASILWHRSQSVLSAQLFSQTFRRRCGRRATRRPFWQPHKHKASLEVFWCPLVRPASPSPKVLRCGGSPFDGEVGARQWNGWALVQV